MLPSFFSLGPYPVPVYVFFLFLSFGVALEDLDRHFVRLFEREVGIHFLD